MVVLRLWLMKYSFPSSVRRDSHPGGIEHSCGFGALGAGVVMGAGC